MCFCLFVFCGCPTAVGTHGEHGSACSGDSWSIHRSTAKGVTYSCLWETFILILAKLIKFLLFKKNKKEATKKESSKRQNQNNQKLHLLIYDVYDVPFGAAILHRGDMEVYYF